MIRDVLKKYAAPAAVLFLIVACTAAPIQNVEQAPITPTPASLADVTKAITRAGVGLGWQMKPIAPGKMEGTLLIRDHKAVVDITYDLKTYSIRYKDSTNLNYDGTNIHRNYNGWITNLDKAIRSQLTL
jgi:hypothetical protein